jgi:hypothetical protein
MAGDGVQSSLARNTAASTEGKGKAILRAQEEEIRTSAEGSSHCDPHVLSSVIQEISHAFG